VTHYLHSSHAQLAEAILWEVNSISTSRSFTFVSERYNEQYVKGGGEYVESRND